MLVASIPDLVSTSGFVLETGRGAVSGKEITEAGRGYAAGFAAYPPGTGVLVSVADPATALEVALGAWWMGLRVAFPRGDSPLDRGQQAGLLHVGVEVVDSLGDELSGVPQRAARDLVGAPVRGAPRCSPADAALDVLTSGSTGVPRCVVNSHAGLVANAWALAQAMAVGPGDRIWTSLPHGLPGVIATVTLTAAVGGATAVLAGRAGALDATSALLSANPSIVYAVPEAYEILSRTSSTGLRRPPVRWWLSSSSALPADRFDRMHARWGAVVRSFYCGSELGTVTFNDGDDVESVRAGAGRPLPGVRLSVESTPGDNAPGAAGHPVGRLTVAGALMAIGYRDGAVVRPFPADGVRTSDRGYLDAAGRLFLTGREEDRIHVGSEVVDPQIVEACIEAHPAVADCIVVARPHPMLGSVLEAWVVRQPGADVSARDVILACRSNGMRGGSVPRSVRWIDAAPRTPAGKPDRAGARLMVAKGLT